MPTTYTPSGQVVYLMPSIATTPISPWATPGFFSTPPQELGAPVGYHEHLLRHSFRPRVWGLPGCVGLSPRREVELGMRRHSEVGVLDRAGYIHAPSLLEGHPEHGCVAGCRQFSFSLPSHLYSNFRTAATFDFDPFPPCSFVLQFPRVCRERCMESMCLTHYTHWLTSFWSGTSPCRPMPPY